MPMAATPTQLTGPLQITLDPSVPLCQLRIERDPKTTLVVLRLTKDGGKTYDTIFASPSASVAAGSVFSLDTKRQAAWLQPATSSVSPSPTASTVKTPTSFYIDLHQTGTIYAGQTFGYFKVTGSTALSCTGLQLSLQTAAVGSAATVCLVAANNIETNQTGSLASGVECGDANFGIPVEMAVGTTWRVRVKAVGSTTAGECLSARLLLSIPI